MQKQGMHRGYSYQIVVIKDFGIVNENFYDPYTDERIESGEPFHAAIGRIKGKEVYLLRFMSWDSLAGAAARVAERFVKERIEKEYPTRRPPVNVMLRKMGFK